MKQGPFGEAGFFDRRAIPCKAVETRWNAPAQHTIRRIDWDAGDSGGAARGSILFMPGRGDTYEKYLETLDYWHRKGWRVTSADWRGQAGSGRLGHDAVTGHIGDFSLWVDDLAAFWAEWKKATPAPHVAAGHSMGGHLVLRALAERRIDPDAVVLSAPMLGFHMPFLPSFVMRAIARLMLRLGDPRRPAWQSNEKPGMPSDSRIDLLTHDPDRYADELWWRQARPELAMGSPSWGWIAAALDSMGLLRSPGFLERITVPILILATCDDRLVDFAASERAAHRLAHGEFLRFGPEARHEILREADPVRNKALAAIDEFLDRVAPLAH